MPALAIRSNARETIREICGGSSDADISDCIGVHSTQVGRVLSGKYAPGNRFIAGVVDACGPEIAFKKVFKITKGATK